MLKLLNNDKGIALPLVFMVMTLVIALAGAMLTLTDTEYKIASNDYSATKSLYLADAGINYAIKLIDKNELNKVPYKFELDAGQGVNVTSIEVAGPHQWKVKAEGKYKKIIKEVSADIELPPNENPLEKINDIQIGILPDGQIKYGSLDKYDDKGNGKVSGNVYYSTNLPGKVNFTSNDYKILQNPGSIVDYITEYGKYVDSMTAVSKADLENTSDNFLENANGMYYYDGTDEEDPPELKGKITYTGKSVLYVKGDLELDGTITYPDDNPDGAFLLIIVTGNVYMTSNNNEDLKFVLCADKVELNNAKANFEGVIITNLLVLHNGNQDMYTYQPYVIRNIDLTSLQLNKQYVISNWKIDK